MDTRATGSATMTMVAPPRPSIGSRIVDFGANSWLQALVFVCLITLWETSVRMADIPRYILPAPSEVANAFYHGFLLGDYIPDLGVTAFETVFGYVIGCSAGLLLGAVIVMFPVMEKIIYPYVVALQTIPKVAIAPLFVVWFGFGLTSKIVIVALVSLFPVLVNVIAGLRAVDQEKLDLLGALSASRWQVFRYLRFPNSLPFVFAGLNTAIILAVIGAIVGEFVGATKGIGFRILQANYALDIAGVFSLFVVLSIMGLVLHWTLKLIERRAVYWANTSAVN